MNDTAAATLNDLIPILKDGEDGFHAAAGDAESPELKQQFEDYAQQRSVFAGELTGPWPAPSASPKIHAQRHRDGRDPSGVDWSEGRDCEPRVPTPIVECEREANDAARLGSIARALQNGPLPADVRSALHLQAAAIETAHIRIRSLRDSPRAEVGLLDVRGVRTHVVGEWRVASYGARDPSRRHHS